ncbi:MAG TPA: methyltransferase, partial [Polyangiaceae bacterium]
DVVWDPFVGSGSELIERARLGPAKKFIGTDIDPAALDAARTNAKAANVDATIVEGDALSYVPGKVTLVLTNPPMGRRVHRGADLRPFFDRFFGHVATVLAPGGRIVLISPLPARTAERARELGLVQERGIDVDMGGFSAQIQHFSRAKAKV